MGLSYQREPAVFQTLDQIHFPQRPRSIESPGQDPTDEFPELGERARSRQRRAPYVEGEVEILVVDPHRSSELSGNPSHPLPISRYEGDPFADQGNEAFIVETIRTGIKDVDRAHMAWRVCGVQGQQRHFEGRKPLRHASLPAWECLEPLRYYRSAACLRANGFASSGRGNLVHTSFVQDWWESGATCEEWLDGFHDQVGLERLKQMSRSTSTIRGALICGAVTLGLLLNGCSATAEPQNTASPSAVSTPSAPSSSAAESPTWVPPSSPALSSDHPLTINIVIAKGKTIPNGVKYDMRVGQKVILNVTSDADDEIHAHTGGAGYEMQVQAGTPAKGSFTVDSPGSFEVESHHLDKIIAILNAR